MIERCKECGANLALVGRRHRCVARVVASGFKPDGGKSASLTDLVPAGNPASTSKKPNKIKAAKAPSAGNPASPEKSDRLIAAEIGVTHPTVAKARKATGNKLPVRTGKDGKKRAGRPKIVGPRPWELAGMSRRTWYRRRAGQN